MSDTCDTGLEIVLAQRGPKDERHANRPLKTNESKYVVIEAEVLAIIVKHFRHYLYGRKATITTDYNPLKCLMNIKDPAGRLARCSLTLQEYDFQIEHRASRKHQNPEALSRIPPIAAFKDIKIEGIIPKPSIDRLC